MYPDRGVGIGVGVGVGGGVGVDVGVPAWVWVCGCAPTTPHLSICPKPPIQPRDAARREECSQLDEKSLTALPL